MLLEERVDYIFTMILERINMNCNRGVAIGDNVTRSFIHTREYNA